MIPHRFARLIGAVLLLAPSLALSQAALQQPCTSAANGCAVASVPSAINALYGNDLFLQNLIAARFNTLGAAALLNVGTVTGTVADGGALAAEITRARAAEQANTTAIQTNTTAIATETSRAQGVEALKAPIASPTFTGVPAAPTAAAGTSTTQLATTAFVATAVAAGGGGGSGGVPTSRQILGGGLATGGGDLTADRTITVPKAAQSDVATGTDDAKALTSYSIAATLGAKAPLASPALVGTPTAPTATAGTSTTQIASTAFVATSYAPLASPALTGNPTAPTQAAGDNSTKLATTAYADRAATATPYIVAESLGATGYRKWSDGVIHQWGNLTSNGGDSVVTLPIAFPTACDRAFGGTSYIPDPTAMFNVSVAPNGLTQIKVSPRITYGQSVAAFGSGAPLFWEAWGR